MKVKKNIENFTRTKLFFSGALLLLFLLSGCSGDNYTTPDGPVLYLDIADYDSDSGYDRITAVSIEKTAPTIQTVSIASTLLMYPNQEGAGQDNMRGGYTFYLEEGAGYDTLNYTEGSSGITINLGITITNAQAGIVYIVRCYL